MIEQLYFVAGNSIRRTLKHLGLIESIEEEREGVDLLVAYLVGHFNLILYCLYDIRVALGVRVLLAAVGSRYVVVDVLLQPRRAVAGRKANAGQSTLSL